jgi:hypothetical protein
MPRPTKQFVVWSALGLAAFGVANAAWRTTTSIRFGDQVEVAPNIHVSKGGTLRFDQRQTHGWPLHVLVREREADEPRPAAPRRTVRTRFSVTALALNVLFFAALVYLLASLVFVRRFETFTWRRVLVWCACLGVLLGIGMLDRTMFVRR